MISKIGLVLAVISRVPKGKAGYHLSTQKMEKETMTKALDKRG